MGNEALGKEPLPERLTSFEGTAKDVLVNRHITCDRLPGATYSLAGLGESGRQGNCQVSLQVFERDTRVPDQQRDQGGASASGLVQRQQRAADGLHGGFDDVWISGRDSGPLPAQHLDRKSV